MVAAYEESLVVLKPYLLSPSLLIKALKLCVQKQVLLIHGNSVTNGFGSNLQLSNGLMNWYAKHGDVKHARKVFDRMPKRNVVSWNVMINGYTSKSCGDTSFRLFHLMLAEGNLLFSISSLTHFG